MGPTAPPKHQTHHIPRTRRTKTPLHPQGTPTTHGNANTGPPLLSKTDQAVTYTKIHTKSTTAENATTTTPGETATTTETTTGETGIAAPTALDGPTADAAPNATAAHHATATSTGNAHPASATAAPSVTAVQPVLAIHRSDTIPTPTRPITGPTVDAPPARGGVPPRGDAPDPHAATAGAPAPRLLRVIPEPHSPETLPAPTIAAKTSTENRHRPDLAAGILAPAEDAMIPTAVRKVFEKGLKTHVPFTNLTDAHCQLEFSTMRSDEHTIRIGPGGTAITSAPDLLEV
ncbi:hypothetical protein FRC08_012774 [Ceratobasidium sp. 394]|nr:hypothetical protein FRC08_012774 [Ceratobasidium sp. 394]